MERVTIDDCRRAGHCAKGVRQWCEAHGFDFRLLVREGLDANALRETGDGYALGCVAKMEERTRG